MPACLGTVSVENIPWAVPFDSIAADRTVDPDKMAVDYITNNYYVYPVECGPCLLKKTCPGIHINYLRSFGFKPRPVLSGKKPRSGNAGKA